MDQFKMAKEMKESEQFNGSINSSNSQLVKSLAGTSSGSSEIIFDDQSK